MHYAHSLPFVTLILAMSVMPAGQTFTQPPRDPSAPQSQTPVGTGSLSGTVVVAGSGQPARRARVTLSGSELRGSRTVTTDELGRFVFPGLPAGRFTLRATKPGHITVTYGQHRPGIGAGTAIQLTDKQRVEVQLQIPRGGVITGTVLDEHAEAIPGTPVRVMRYVMQSGQRTLQQAGNGSTDDRGIYRIYGLQPGEYIVAAVPRNTQQRVIFERAQAELQTALQQRAELAGRGNLAQAELVMERLSALGVTAGQPDDDVVEGYAPVYYPGTTAPASAATVLVGVAEEKVGVDFQLQLVPVARVEGVVVASSGPTPRNVQITLLNVGHDVPGLGNSTARSDAEGRFRLSNVAPGQYVLMARGTTGEPGRGGRGAPILEALGRGRGAAQAETTRVWAMTDVVVDGRDVSNVVLTLQPGMTVSGRIAFDGTALQPPADLTRIRVNVAPMGGSANERRLASSANTRVNADGRFTVTGVVPGSYRVTASGASGGWTLGSSVVDGKDTLDFPIDVKPNQNVSGVALTFIDRQTEITGVIVNDQNQPAPDYTIIVYPADRGYWTPQSRRIRSTRPATDGRYVFPNLPPGDYRIAPVLDPEPGIWYDPAFLQQLDATALRVPLGDGEKKVQNLRLALGG